MAARGTAWEAGGAFVAAETGRQLADHVEQRKHLAGLAPGSHVKLRLGIG